jgi:hypothetical protein
MDEGPPWKEQTSVVKTVNDTGDKIVLGVVDTCQK